MESVNNKISSYEVDDLGWTREEVIKKQFEDQIFEEGKEAGIETVLKRVLKKLPKTCQERIWQ